MLYRRRRLLLLAQASLDQNLRSLLESLYGNGEQGAFYVTKPQVMGQQVLFQDAAGTTPVTAPGDPVGLMLDVSPNGNHLSQSVSGSRPVLVQDGGSYHLKLDKVDDNLSVSLPGAVNGTMLLATTDGIVHAHVDIPAGVWSITTNPQYYPGDTFVGLILRDGHMNEQELAAAKDYLISIGAGANQFAGVGGMQNWFHSRGDLTALLTGDWDTSSVTSFYRFALGATNLTTLDVSNWDTSSVTSFEALAFGATSLTTLDVSNWDTSNVTSFEAFIRGASSITTLDVSNWDTSSVTRFNGFARDATSLHTVIVNGGTGNPFADSPCTNYTNAFTNTNLSQQSIDDILEAIEAAGTSNGTFDQSGGSAPSARGMAAVEALRARGWTVTVTGGGTPSIRTLSFATTNYGTEHDVFLPEAADAGRTVFMFITIDGTDTIQLPDGWDVIYSLTNSLTAICLKRTMNGTEPPAINITTSHERKVSWVAACVEGALGEYDAEWVDNIDDPTTAVTPALETRFGNNFLWLSAVHWRQGSRTVEGPTGFSAPFWADTGFAGPTEHHTAIAALASDETSLAADAWVSNQVSPEESHAITSLIAIYPVEDYAGGNHLPDTSDWILHNGAFVTHHGSPVTYGE